MKDECNCQECAEEQYLQHETTDDYPGTGFRRLFLTFGKQTST
jgi:hypothetical protein